MPLLCQRSSRAPVVVPPLSRFLFSLLFGLLFTCYRCICSYPIHSFGPFPSIAALFVYTLPLHLITSPLHPLGSVLFPVSLHLSTVSCVCHLIVSDLCDLASSLSLADELRAHLVDRSRASVGPWTGLAWVAFADNWIGQAPLHHTFSPVLCT